MQEISTHEDLRIPLHLVAIIKTMKPDLNSEKDGLKLKLCNKTSICSFFVLVGTSILT